MKMEKNQNFEIITFFSRKNYFDFKFFEICNFSRDLTENISFFFPF